MSADGRSLAFPGVLAIQSDIRPGDEQADTLLVAVSPIGSDRHVKITTFSEGRFGGQTRQRGGLERDLEGDCERDVHVPLQASMFIANMGIPPLSKLPNALWVGWILDRTVAAFSPRQSSPMVFTLAEHEQVVALPLAMGNGTMHLYTVRGSNTARRALWRHVFHDGEEGPSRVVSEVLAPLDNEPLFPVAAPRVGEYGVRAVLGWLESTPSGVIAVLALVDGSTVSFVRSDPTPDLIPFPRQRLGLWKGGNEIELAGILEDRTALPGYTRLVLHYAPDDEQPRRTVTKSPAFPAGRLRACALDYKKWVTTKVAPVDLALDTEGNLVTFDPIPGSIGSHIIDQGLPADYSLPFAVTKTFFVADFSDDGKVTLWHFTEAR